MDIGWGISSPNLWREQRDPSQPQVPSGIEPENFPVLNHTTKPRARKSFPWVSTFLLLNPEHTGLCACNLYNGKSLKERGKKRDHWSWCEKTKGEIPAFIGYVPKVQQCHYGRFSVLLLFSYSGRPWLYPYPVLPFPFDHILFCVLIKAWWDFSLSMVNNPLQLGKQSPNLLLLSV